MWETHLSIQDSISGSKPEFIDFCQLLNIGSGDMNTNSQFYEKWTGTYELLGLLIIGFNLFGSYTLYICPQSFTYGIAKTGKYDMGILCVQGGLINS